MDKTRSSSRSASPSPSPSPSPSRSASPAAAEERVSRSRTRSLGPSDRSPSLDERKIERSSSRRPRSEERHPSRPLPPPSDERLTRLQDRFVTRKPSAAPRSRILKEKGKIREKLENISAQPTYKEQNEALQEAAEYVLKKQKNPTKRKQIQDQLLREQARNDNEYVRRDARALSYSMQDGNINITPGNFNVDIQATIASSGQDLADNMEYVGLKLQQDPEARFVPRAFDHFVDFLIPKMNDPNPNVRQNARWLLDRLRVKADVRMSADQLDLIKKTLIASRSHERDPAVSNNTELFLQALGVEERWQPITPTALPHAAHPSSAAPARPASPTTTTTTTSKDPMDQLMTDLRTIEKNALLEENEKLKQQLATEHKALGEKSTEIDKMQTEIATLKKDLETQKLQSDLELIQAKEINEGVQAEISELLGKEFNADETLESTFISLKKEFEINRKQLKDNEKEIELHQGDIEGLRIKLNEKETNIANLIANLKQENERVKKLNESLEKLNDELKDIDIASQKQVLKDQGDAQKEIEKLKQEKTELEKTHENYKAKNLNAVKSLKEAHNKELAKARLGIIEVYDSQETKIQEIKNEKKKIEDEFHEMKSTFEETAAKLFENQEALEKAKNEFEKEKEKIKQTLEEAREQIASLKKEKTDLEKEKIESQQKAKDELQQKVEGTEKQLKDATARLQTMATNNAKLKRSEASAKDEITNLKKANENSQKELEELKEQLEKLQNEIKELQAAKTELEKAADSDEAVRFKNAKTIKDQEDKIKEQEGKIKTLDRELENQKRLREEQRKRIEKSNQTSKELLASASNIQKADAQKIAKLEAQLKAQEAQLAAAPSTQAAEQAKELSGNIEHLTAIIKILKNRHELDGLVLNMQDLNPTTIENVGFKTENSQEFFKTVVNEEDKKLLLQAQEIQSEAKKIESRIQGTAQQIILLLNSISETTNIDTFKQSLSSLNDKLNEDRNALMECNKKLKNLKSSLKGGVVHEFRIGRVNPEKDTIHNDTYTNDYLGKKIALLKDFINQIP